MLFVSSNLIFCEKSNTIFLSTTKCSATKGPIHFSATNEMKKKYEYVEYKKTTPLKKNVRIERQKCIQKVNRYKKRNIDSYRERERDRERGREGCPVNATAMLGYVH
jgi:hypothetical protein